METLIVAAAALGRAALLLAARFWMIPPASILLWIAAVMILSRWTQARRDAALRHGG